MTVGRLLLIVAIGWTLLWLFAGFLAGRASAHEPYSEWKDSRGYSCCNEHDCRPTVTCEPWPGALGVRAEGRCVAVPKDALIDRPSPDGRTHVCMAKGALFPACVVIAPPKS